MNVTESYINRFEESRKRRNKIIALFVVVAIVVAFAVYAVLRTSGSAMTGDPICGKVEHVHGDACYEQVLTCGMEEGQQLAATGQEQEAVHHHSEACYTPTLICGFAEEHLHSADCYSDISADLETAETMDNSLPAELTGLWDLDLTEIAKSQIGYAESTENVQVAEDGVTLRGYTRYGEWYGDPYGPWNIMFAQFCLENAGVTTEYLPRSINAQQWCVDLQRAGLFTSAAGYVPTPGDLVVLDMNADNAVDTVGIVVRSNEDSRVMTVVAGDMTLQAAGAVQANAQATTTTTDSTEEAAPAEEASTEAAAPAEEAAQTEEEPAVAADAVVAMDYPMDTATVIGYVDISALQQKVSPIDLEELTKPQEPAATVDEPAAAEEEPVAAEQPAHTAAAPAEQPAAVEQPAATEPAQEPAQVAEPAAPAKDNQANAPPAQETTKTTTAQVQKFNASYGTALKLDDFIDTVLVNGKVILRVEEEKVDTDEGIVVNRKVVTNEPIVVNDKEDVKFVLQFTLGEKALQTDANTNHNKLVYKIPSAITLNEAQNGTKYDKQGNEIYSYTLSQAGDLEITISDDYVKANVGSDGRPAMVINGEFGFTVNADKIGTGVDGSQDLTFIGQTTTKYQRVDFTATNPDYLVVNKAVAPVPVGNTGANKFGEYVYTIQVGSKLGTKGPITLTDKMPAEMIIPGGEAKFTITRIKNPAPEAQALTLGTVYQGIYENTTPAQVFAALKAGRFGDELAFNTVKNLFAEDEQLAELTWADIAEAQKLQTPPVTDPDDEITETEGPQVNQAAVDFATALKGVTLPSPLPEGVELSSIAGDLAKPLTITQVDIAKYLKEVFGATDEDATAAAMTLFTANDPQSVPAVLISIKDSEGHLLGVANAQVLSDTSSVETDPHPQFKLELPALGVNEFYTITYIGKYVGDLDPSSTDNSQTVVKENEVDVESIYPIDNEHSITYTDSDTAKVEISVSSVIEKKSTDKAQENEGNTVEWSILVNPDGAYNIFEWKLSDEYNGQIYGGDVKIAQVVKNEDGTYVNVPGTEVDWNFRSSTFGETPNPYVFPADPESSGVNTHTYRVTYTVDKDAFYPAVGYDSALNEAQLEYDAGMILTPKIPGGHGPVYMLVDKDLIVKDGKPTLVPDTNGNVKPDWKLSFNADLGDTATQWTMTDTLEGDQWFTHANLVAFKTELATKLMSEASYTGVDGAYIPAWVYGQNYFVYAKQKGSQNDWYYVAVEGDPTQAGQKVVDPLKQYDALKIEFFNKLPKGTNFYVEYSTEGDSNTIHGTGSLKNTAKVDGLATDNSIWGVTPLAPTILKENGAPLDSKDVSSGCNWKVTVAIPENMDEPLNVRDYLPKGLSLKEIKITIDEGMSANASAALGSNELLETMNFIGKQEQTIATSNITSNQFTMSFKTPYYPKKVQGADNQLVNGQPTESEYQFTLTQAPSNSEDVDFECDKHPADQAGGTTLDLRIPKSFVKLAADSWKNTIVINFITDINEKEVDWNWAVTDFNDNQINHGTNTYLQHWFHNTVDLFKVKSDDTIGEKVNTDVVGAEIERLKVGQSDDERILDKYSERTNKKNELKYTLDLNPEKLPLKPQVEDEEVEDPQTSKAPEKLVIYDEMTYTTGLDNDDPQATYRPGSIGIEEEVDGKWTTWSSDMIFALVDVEFSQNRKPVDGNKEEVTNTLKITVPNGKHLKITYFYDTQGGKDKKLHLSNTAKIMGLTGTQTENGDAKDEEFQDSYLEMVLGGTWIALYKYDDGHKNNPLEGAEFKLWKVNEDKNGWEPLKDKDGKEIVYVTSKTGFAYMTNLECDVIYKLEETKAPEGYARDTSFRYFYIKGPNSEGAPSIEGLEDRILEELGNNQVELKEWTNKSQQDIPNSIDPYELPETGGPGTTLIYLVGGALVVLALGLGCVRRKSMNHERR